MHKILIVTLILMLMQISLLNTSRAEEDKVSKNPKGTLTKDTKSQTLKSQTTDIVSGKPMNRNIYTDYKGKRIYFCCDAGRSNFNMDPEKYIKTFQDQGWPRTIETPQVPGRDDPSRVSQAAYHINKSLCLGSP